MKIKILIALLFCFYLLGNIKAQNSTPIPTFELSKFCGNWQWVNGGDTLFISLTLTTDTSLGVEYLKGTHKYIKNGLVIANFLQNSLLSVSLRGMLFSDNLNKLIGKITDMPTTNSRKLQLDYISTTSLRLWVTSLEGVHMKPNPGTPAYEAHINLPSGITLTKL